MAVRLFKIDVAHIAGVRSPANRKKFLIIKEQKLDSDESPIQWPVNKREFAEAIIKTAEAKGQTLDQFFAERPELYNDYCQIDRPLLIGAKVVR